MTATAGSQSHGSEPEGEKISDNHPIMPVRIGSISTQNHAREKSINVGRGGRELSTSQWNDVAWGWSLPHLQRGCKLANVMEFLRKVDFERLAAASEKVSESLFSRDSGATSCSVSCIQTPSGEGSPAGLHTHQVDQLFYILSGTMSLEIDGDAYEASPGTLVVFPAGIPHRNWNGGNQPTVHLAINAPLPDPAVPFAQRVG
jgi:quercetin dioxygenase-like cupin family protein